MIKRMGKEQFLYPFNKHLLSAYCKPGTVWDTRDLAANRTDNNPYLHGVFKSDRDRRIQKRHKIGKI